MGIFSKRPESYKKKKDYTFEGAELGTGAFGVVRKALWKGRDPPVQVAVKVIEKKKVKNQEHLIWDEMNVMKGLDHPNIVHFYDWHLGLPKELMDCRGGELFERIYDEGKLTEDVAVDMINSTLGAVKYLHDHGIVHRDIKPENLVFREKGSSDLLICDFGIAQHITDDEQLTSIAGSPGYAAPEVLNRLGHSYKVDVWSVGIVCYTLLCGFTPFRAADRAELIEETTKARLEFPERYWQNVSDLAKEFIKYLVQPNVDLRPTAAQALAHPWLTQEQPANKHDLSVGIKENWTPKQRWQSAINKVMVANRFNAVAGDAKRKRAESIGTTFSSSSSSSSNSFASAHEGSPKQSTKLPDLQTRVAQLAV